MRASARNRVQLTSLLDLLFIMIFIALLTTKVKSHEASLQHSPTDPDSSEVRTTGSLRERERIRAVANGQIRKLFISNNYYGGRESYIETNLYAADTNQLWIYRMNLTGAGLVDDVNDAPIAPDDPNRDGQRCEEVVVSRERLVHDCRTFETTGAEIERHEISCDRASNTAYQCTERLLQAKGAGVRDYNWNYRMELVRVFDETLK